MCQLTCQAIVPSGRLPREVTQLKQPLIVRTFPKVLDLGDPCSILSLALQPSNLCDIERSILISLAGQTAHYSVLRREGLARETSILTLKD